MHYKVSNHLIYLRINIEMWFKYKFDTNTSAAIISMYSFITSQKQRSSIFVWENEFHILYNAANMTTLMN